MLGTKIAKLMFLLLLCIACIFTIWKVAFLHQPSEEKKTCGCEKCVSDPEHWFTQRLQRDIPPFLSSNHNVTLQAFKWWRVFFCRGCNITYFTQVQQRIFEFFPGPPSVPEADPKRCLRCAVVGNSGNLKRSHYGKLIDLHDFVFRINYGRIYGFEEDVGRRTTHRVMYPESSTHLDKDTHMVLFPFKTRDLEWLANAPNGINRTEWFRDDWMKRPIRAKKNLVMVANPDFMKYVHRSWLQSKGLYPSTGFMTVVLALHMCDQVSVFGFGADSDGNWSHYWEVLRWKNLKTGNHPGSVEYDTIVELGRRGKVAFYSGL